jgi:hypothetical protein
LVERPDFSSRQAKLFRLATSEFRAKVQLLKTYNPYRKFTLRPTQHMDYI